MKTKTILSVVVVCAIAAACLLTSVTAFAKDDPNMGTWKLNESKSKFPKGAPKNTTVVYEAAGNDIKVTVDGVDGAGGATHNEWTGKFDRKFYPITGDPTTDERSYRRINANTLALTNRKAGKVTVTGTIVVSTNGKSRTVTTMSTDAKGKRSRSVAVYDKA